MRRLLGLILLAVGADGQNVEHPSPAPEPTFVERPVSAPVPTYEVRHTAVPVATDGYPDETAWKRAGDVTFQFPWDEQTGAKQKTTARLLWDDNCLYVTYACEDTDIVAHYEHRDDPTYKDHAVELLINPDPKHEIYLGLEMNARAVLCDYVFIYPQVILREFDLKGVRVAVRRDGPLNGSSGRVNGWDLEVAIPLRNFYELTRWQPVVPGTIWRANLCRWDGTEPHRRLSVWSDSALVRPSPHNPKRFGQLVFVP
jgi:Carbohydrate-binding family 9